MTDPLSFLEYLAAQIDAPTEPFVLFRRPMESDVELWVGSESEQAKRASLSEGFHLAPFELGALPHLVLEPKAKSKGWREIAKYWGCKEPKELTTFVESQVAVQLDGKEDYAKAFDAVLAKLKQGALRKVVLSHRQQVEVSSEIIAEAFMRALSLYPEAFIYLYSSSSAGSHMAATPELLMEIRGREVRTVSLAGTVASAEGADVSKWSEKNKQEHQIVTDYIEDRLRPYCEQLEVSPSVSLPTGELYHLLSPLAGELLADANIFQILIDIHPTPAVCGTPKQDAMKCIAENETTSRGYYAGFVGPWSESGGAFYVNIRSLKFSKRCATLSAGGGLVLGSRLEDEWQELSAKMQTLARLF